MTSRRVLNFIGVIGMLLSSSIWANPPEVSNIRVVTHNPYGVPSRYPVEVALDQSAPRSPTYYLAWSIADNSSSNPTVSSDSTSNCSSSGNCVSSGSSSLTTSDADAKKCFKNSHGTQRVAVNQRNQQFFIEQIKVCDHQSFDITVQVTTSAAGMVVASKQAPAKIGFVTGRALPNSRTSLVPQQNKKITMIEKPSGVLEIQSR